MRTPLLAGLLALLLPACLMGEISDVGGDDPGMGSGSGDGDGDGSDNVPTPRVTASIDKSTVATELGKTEMVVITLDSVDGFTGPVTVTPTLLDGATDLTGWTVSTEPALVSLAPDASATVTISVQVPTDAASLAPMMRVDLTSTAEPVSVATAFEIAKQLTIVIPANTGETGPHAGLPAANAPLRVLPGTKLIFHNADEIQHVIHGDGGIPHENVAQGQPGTDYVVTVNDSATWYCHNHEGGGTSRPVLVQ